ncbi:M28 family metallopeptidase [Alteromonadaceae bacterium BrNp21-10]|nr:M28 family metallopeptidase [Alteromonadaceae bacterium BrNp21-10]
MLKYVITALSMVLLSGCLADSKTTNQTTQPRADANKLKAHIAFLADDLLEGRDTGSQGHEIASKYIANQFAQIGLVPAGDEGAYMQRVPFRKAELEQTSPNLVLHTSEGDVALDYPKDYITSASVINTHSELKGELVFVGYGIISPELDHDDYQGVDVEGKVVVLLSGKPQSFPSEEGAHFASSREKVRYAVEHGAIGIITLSTPLREKVRPYQRSLNYIHTPKLRWLDKQGQPNNAPPEIKNSAYFNMQSAAHLFAGAAKSLDEIYAELEEDKSPKGFDLPISISFSKDSLHSEISSPNVAAILPGSDPQLKNEYLLYSAHSDHLGIAKSVAKDKINNGAMDNATGTATLIEMARLMSLGEVPKRSVLFVAVTGEEKGLLGSDYFAHYPTVDIKSIIANVNLDMPVLTYDFADVIAFGAEHSNLKQNVAAAAQEIGVTLSADPMPEQNIFTRSDHYMFVKQGVPAVYVIPGLTEIGGEVGTKFKEFLQTAYHKPSDELTNEFNWTAATKFAEVNLHIGLSIANQTAKPQWNSGDFFGNTFAAP